MPNQLGVAGAYVKCTRTIPNHFMDIALCNKKSDAKCFNHFKTVTAIQDSYRTLPEGAEYTYSSRKFLHRFSQPFCRSHSGLKITTVCLGLKRQFLPIVVPLAIGGKVIIQFKFKFFISD